MAEGVNVLFGSKRGAIIGTLRLDMTVDENHQLENQVTEYPIEEGGNISDHIRQLPDKLTLNGLVTNTPINLTQQSNAEIITNAQGKFEVRNLERAIVNNRVISAFEQLLTMSGRKVNGETIDPQIIKVVTGLRVYTNMAIQTISVPRSKITGLALRFNITLINVIKVDSETIAIPNPKPNIKDGSTSTVDKGKVNGKQTTDGQKVRVSKAKRAFDAAIKLFN